MKHYDYLIVGAGLLDAHLLTKQRYMGKVA